MFSYIVLGEYSVTNSNGKHLKLNYDFNCCKNVIFKILRYSKGSTKIPLVRFVSNLENGLLRNVAVTG